MGEHLPNETIEKLRADRISHAFKEAESSIRIYLNLHAEVPGFVDRQVIRIKKDLQKTASLMRKEQELWDH